MHEFALCRSIAATVLDHAAGRRVELVTLRIGHLRQVVPETLVHAWELAADDPVLAGSRVDVVHVPVTVRCRACGVSSTLEVPVLQCDACLSTDVEVTSGEEFFIESIDVVTS